MQLSTVAVHAQEASSRVDGAAVFPIFQTATFTCNQETLKPGVSGYGAVRYTRCNNNPSQVVLARKLAQLEGAEAALVTGSGMAAITSALMAFLSAGDHALVQKCLYGGTYTFVHKMLPRMGVQVTEVDINDSDSWPAQVKPNTKIIYVETISNPLCGIPDLPTVVQLAQKHDLISIVDNTFASPANFRPLQHGFDLVIESATKFLNGHSDVVAGVVAGSKTHIDKVLDQLNHLGGMLDPHACFLLQRGIKTLGLRVARQNVNALALATALEAHPGVAKVYYPGLSSHPQHELAQSLFKGGAGVSWDSASAVRVATHLASQHQSIKGIANGDDTHQTPEHLAPPATVQEPGYGGMLSVEFHGGLAASEAFLAALGLAINAPSLGGVETLVVLPSTSSHAGQTAEQRAAVGITDGLVRIAVGIEDPQDLVEDFLNAADLAARAAA